jgi:hypothetical protein
MVAELSDQLFLFGVNADDRQAGITEQLLLGRDVLELGVALGGLRRRSPLLVVPEGELHLAEESPDGRMANLMAKFSQTITELFCTATYPHRIGHWIAGNFVCEKLLQVRNDAWELVCNGLWSTSVGPWGQRAGLAPELEQTYDERQADGIAASDLAETPLLAIYRPCDTLAQVR